MHMFSFQPRHRVFWETVWWARSLQLPNPEKMIRKHMRSFYTQNEMKLFSKTQLRQLLHRALSSKFTTSSRMASESSLVSFEMNHHQKFSKSGAL